MGTLMLDRRSVVKTLLHDRNDLLVVTGLGSPTYDVAAAGDHPHNFYLWGAMGGAAMMGLGLALARPCDRVLVITGDGEMLMGIGSLATIGLHNPTNLTIVILDNGVYGETGMQPSHTQKTDLAAVARACGLTGIDVADANGVASLAERLKTAKETLVARVRIRAEEPPRVLPSRDGVALKNRFREALAVA